MSNLGPVFEDDEHHSPGRGNAGKIVRDTAENILAIADTKQVGAAIPTTTFGGLIANVTYVPLYNASFVRTGWKAVSGMHDHSSDTDVDGGSFLNIKFANIENVQEITRWLSPIPEDFVVTKVGTGTLTKVTSGAEGYLQLITSGASNDLITALATGPRLEWDTLMSLQLKMDISNNSSLLARLGINTDRVEDAQDTARRQMGMEACDGHGTNWVIINANGNTSSLVPTATSAALAEGGRTGYALVHIPATEVRLYKDGVSVGVSTTNVASSSGSDSSRLFIWGLKTTTGSTRNIKLRLAYIIGKISANNLFQL